MNIVLIIAAFVCAFAVVGILAVMYGDRFNKWLNDIEERIG